MNRRQIGWWHFLAWLLMPLSATAQSLDAQKAGVVRIGSQSEGLHRTGTGFIVRLEPDAAYIVTAAHVVEGDAQPQVEFFTRRNLSVPAQTLHVEAGDPGGLALLVVRGKDNVPAGAAALPFATGAEPSGGEAVTVIGFPQGGGAWAVLRANVVSREGRDLLLDGSIAEGNSGGPVLLGDKVVAMVTSVGGAGRFGHAVPTALVRLVLDGWGMTLAQSAASRDKAPEPPARTPSSQPPVAPAPAGGPGNVRITRANCEKLRASTAFRVTVNGEADGPEGTALHAAFLRDAKELSRPRVECAGWKNCQRATGESERTQWSISVMVLAPAPTDTAISLQRSDGSSDRTVASASAALKCLLY